VPLDIVLAGVMGQDGPVPELLLVGRNAEHVWRQHQRCLARWLSLYPEHHGWWNEADEGEPDDPLEVPVRGLLRLKPASFRSGLPRSYRVRACRGHLLRS
jgi:hypothetical protein